MSRQEFRASISLAAIFSLRMLGLFMIYPVFAAYGRHLSGATPYKIGLALGIYGLSQAVLQIPFGLLSDKIGRKSLIIAGLLLFMVGSAVGALSTSIDGMIVGRALQGGGAVGSVILALVADLTAEENRTKAMAIVGVTIGSSFMVALIVGPVLAGLVGVPGIFWVMIGLALVGVGVIQLAVPRPPQTKHHRDAETIPGLLGRVFANGELLRLDFGILALHAMLTASFLVIPHLLHDTIGVTSDDQWMVYLPVLVVSVVVMVPAIVLAEKYRHMKAIFLGAVAMLFVSQLLLLVETRSAGMMLLAVTLFFSGFNILEACLPSLVTKTAPLEAKGTATGVYSSLQFFGIFIGGAFGGWVNQTAGTASVFALTAGFGLLWFLTALSMKDPIYLATKLLRIGSSRNTEDIIVKLRAVPGVADAVFVAEEGLAYLKVDSKLFDVERAKSIVSA
ncbi:MAG: MFS transporter [Alphaproteobacteria bacterium]|nr:MFS transporter [Alphaproteobacteria bacterium]MDE2499889.1 MFS transporter [Alphaproteobacteria bacterium]